MKPIYKQILFTVGVVLLTVFLCQKCDRADIKTLSPSNKNLQKRESSLKKELVKAEAKAIKSESVTIEYRDRWYKTKDRIIRKDSLIRRDSVIYLAAACDSARGKDSVLIKDLKVINGIQKQRIFVKDSIHSNDSTALVAAKKDARKQRRQKFAILGLWVLREGASISNRLQGQ